MKKLLSLLLVLSLCLMGVSALAEIEYAEGLSQVEIDALETTTVIKSDDSPTGYYVTFRYKDPEASRVRIYGEWKFSDLAHATRYTSLNAAPEEWQNGYTVWATNGWPTADMALNEATGVWSYTIPLPNGTFAYRFYVGGVEGAELTDYTDAAMVADPANVNYLATPEETGGEQMLTSVYVPYDAEKQSESISHIDEAPRAEENGTVCYETITLESGINTTYAYYLPYGFDENREESYPIAIMFHGGGGYYGSWFSNGLANILDNVIAEGRMEPTIVVTPNGSDFGEDREAILDYVVNTILPNMEEHYNAATTPARRAFIGLSAGGATTGYAMFHYTDEFDTYCLFSPPFQEGVQPDYEIPELKEKNIFIGYGEYDQVLTYGLHYLIRDEEGNLIPFQDKKDRGSLYEYLIGLSGAGVDFQVDIYPFGHTWALWRKLAADIFTGVLWK